ncbi:hypothetical protein [Pseudomonas sp. DP-17]|uniref:hypothetical protein n=1 Tax=Pseudomonas sp. DP-17 TaxID=1580486 RepID=UPI001EFBC3BB|nr:hypothetical protein [Pseudomonas sp. DP-17]MCG8906257.1 hypothetical protein [Pseudomonas sp. DP-17]
MKESKKAEDLHLGLSGINLNSKTIDFGSGVLLRSTYAHIFSTDILAFEKPKSFGSFHPGPWQAISDKKGIDITAELHVPKEYSHAILPNFLVANTLVSLLRLWVDPGIAIQVLSPTPIESLKLRAGKDKGGEFAAMLNGQRDRHVHIGLVRGDKIIESIDWVVKNWENALDLRASKPELSFAIETFENAQCIPNTAMMIVSLWGALEAIFAPHKAELVFRVSSQLAAFLEPRGPMRLQKQRDIVKLYNIRSAAAHGFPKHADDDLIQTFELLRIAIIRMIERKQVPNKEQLETLLFSDQ